MAESSAGIASPVNASVRKCIFPAAGYGTRFLPATKAMPKEMLPILDKPLVQYGVEEAVEAGMTDIGFVTGRGKRAIEDHFDVSYELEHQIQGTGKEKLLDGIRSLIDQCTFSYTRQITMKGLGHAILTGRTLVGDEPFGVVLADDLCFGEGSGVLAQMARLFRQFRCSIVAIQEVPRSETSNYGIIAGEALSESLFRVTDMVEKPAPDRAPSNLAIIGRYILTPDVFDVLERTAPGKNGEIQITDALLQQAREGCVIAYKFKGRRFDCGTIPGFVEATNYCYERGVREESRAGVVSIAR
jgi:UTP--glucose-1-phosphate uridylyltransferase